MQNIRKSAAFFLMFTLLAALPAHAAAPDITPAPGQVNPYRTRSELLMDAAKHTGVSTPEQAAAIWAKGLEQRSAALQYTVMTAALQDEYAAGLDALRSNCVTGMSSPWVQNAAFTSVRRPDNTHAEISLRFETASSAGPAGTYTAKLWLVREGGFWRIGRIRAEEGLYPYTLYKPERSSPSA